MENDEEFFDEDFFYPFDFEDGAEDLVGVEEFFIDVHGDGEASFSTSLFHEGHGTWHDGYDGERKRLERIWEDGHEGQRVGLEGC